VTGSVLRSAGRYYRFCTIGKYRINTALRSRPWPERVRPRLRSNDLALRPHGSRGLNIPGQQHPKWRWRPPQTTGNAWDMSSNLSLLQVRLALQRLIWFSLLPKLCIGYVHSWIDSVLVKPNFRCLHITLARQQLKWDLRLAFEIHYEALRAEDIRCTAASTVITCIITMDCTDAGVSGHRHARSDSDVFKHDFIFVSQSTYINWAHHFLCSADLGQRRTARKVSAYRPSPLFSSFTAFLASAVVIFLSQKLAILGIDTLSYWSLCKNLYSYDLTNQTYMSIHLSPEHFVLYMYFSHPRSEGRAHHGRTFSIYLHSLSCCTQLRLTTVFKE